MDKYEQISVIGEGSYGVVLKCRHRETNQLVAVKKFLETDEDESIKKITLREIAILRGLKHENLVTLIEVFRHKKRFYLVFEYLEWTVLDELDRMPSGLGHRKCKERIFQVIRAISYCHKNHVIHRDVKPENVLVSLRGVVKLCDFGFARRVNMSNESCTGYVATRWYRAPELLLGERNYGAGVDIWAIGCLFAEMMTGDPIFPGQSDIDQIYLIVKLLGKPCLRNGKRLSKPTQFKDLDQAPINSSVNLDEMLSSWPPLAVDFFKSCLKMNPQQRSSANDLLKHEYFTEDEFSHTFLKDLRKKVEMEFNNPLLKKYKSEILVASEKADEMKPDDELWSNMRASAILSTKHVKRKLNCTDLHENCITSTKSENCLNPSKESLMFEETEEYYGTELSKTLVNNYSEHSVEKKVTGSSINCDPKSDENSLKNPSQSSSFDNISKQSHKKDLGDVLTNKDTQSHTLRRSKSSLTIKGSANTCNQETNEFSLVCGKTEPNRKEKMMTQGNCLLNVEPFVPNEIDPVYRYKKRKRKRNTLDISLPTVVVEKM